MAFPKLSANHGSGKKSKMAAPSDKPSIDMQIRNKLGRIYSKFVYKDECLVPKDGKSPTMTKDGYLRYHLRYPGAVPVYTTLHRAVFILEKRKPEMIRNRTAGDVSHLCGKKSCINIEHLCIETASLNSYRRGCHQQGRCFGCEPPCVFINQVE